MCMKKQCVCNILKYIYIYPIAFSARKSLSKPQNICSFKSKHKIIKITKLTFLQPFSFPNFLSFLSKQQAPMLLCVKCRVEWGCRPLKCLSLSLTTA